MLQASAGAEPTRQYFAATDVGGGKDSFNRTSLAAMVGWQASKALAGSPTPIDQEVAAIMPGFAVVMFGTNETDPCCVEAFEKNLTAVVDALVQKGVVPLVSSIPPRGDDAAANALVPEMNAVVRAVAQHRQIPYMDFWQTLINLPSYGLAGDGVHPQVYVSSGVHGCWFTDPALQLGVNQRNQLVLDSLDRVKRALVDGAPPEAGPPALAGSGTFPDPYLVDALPFVDSADTSSSPSSVAGVYSCAPQNEGGPEIVYRDHRRQSGDAARARVRRCRRRRRPPLAEPALQGRLPGARRQDGGSGRAAGHLLAGGGQLRLGGRGQGRRLSHHGRRFALKVHRRAPIGRA